MARDARARRQWVSVTVTEWALSKLLRCAVRHAAVYTVPRVKQPAPSGETHVGVMPRHRSEVLSHEARREFGVAVAHRFEQSGVLA